jgi:hypothetical protein
VSADHPVIQGSPTTGVEVTSLDAT